MAPRSEVGGLARIAGLVPHDAGRLRSWAEFQAVGSIAGQEVVEYLTGRQSLDQTLDRSDARISTIMRSAGYYE